MTNCIIKPNNNETHSHVPVPEARVPLLMDDALPITDHPGFETYTSSSVTRIHKAR